MEIVHVSCVAPPELGGIGKVATEEVVRLCARGYDASQISLTSNALIRVGNAGLISHLSKLLSSADIVHLHYPFYGVAGTVARLRRSGQIKRLVMTLHMDAMAPGLKGWIADRHREYVQSDILRAADLLIASSQDYAEHSSYREVASRVVELPFGVDEMRFIAGPVDRALFGIPEEPHLVVFVGAMDTAHAFKGIDVLLHAISKLPKEIWCVLAGEGNLRTEYEMLARQLGIADRVRFLGRVSPTDLPKVFRMADVVTMPSISGAEAFGLVALEAQSTSVPVVASDLPGVRAVIADKETGFLVTPKDVYALATRIQYLVDDKATRVRMGEEGRKRVLDLYTWSRHMDRLIELYEKICVSPS